MCTMSQPSANQSLRRALAAVCLLLPLCAAATLGGCSSLARPMMSDAELRERADAESEAVRAMFRGSMIGLVRLMEEEYRAGDGSEPPTLHVLALSGGGDFGAFGAGFLVGWGEAPGAEWRRPEFHAVTGVSTGALLAPFAFLGDEASLRLVEEFYRNPKPDWVRRSGLLFFLPHRLSFATIPGLERDIRNVVNTEFIARLAEQWRRGRVLAISATNLDLGRQRYWNIGEEAVGAVEEEDLDRVQRILLASAAIPAVFPPVKIDDMLYADGGITANVFVRLDAHAPDSFIPRWRTAYPDKPLPRMRYWIIVNNQLAQPPGTVRMRWPSIVEPSLATSIRFATIAEIRWLAAQAAYANLLMDADIEVRVVAIPNDWRAPVSGAFQRETMVSLSDLGRMMGADPQSWQVWAARDQSRVTVRPVE